MLIRTLCFFLIVRRPTSTTLTYTLFPYTTLFRSTDLRLQTLRDLGGRIQRAHALCRRDLCFGGSNQPLPRSRTRAVGGHARRRDSRSDHQSGVDALVAVRQGAEPQSQRRISRSLG